jgi:hypothetical protein
MSMSDDTIEISKESMDPSLVETLREQVAIRQGPDDKTIILFDYCYDTSVKRKRRVYYDFIAIWIAETGNWYCTGRGGGVPRETTHDELMKILGSTHVRRASVAVAFEAFKP